LQEYDDEGWNYVFVGVEGAPAKSDTSKKDQVTTVKQTPRTAEKPYLVEKGGKWFIAVPSYHTTGIIRGGVVF
jgi:hypothetical protein